MELRGKRCSVRTYRPDDAASLAANANNRKVWLNLRDRFPHPFTETNGAEWISHVLSTPGSQNFAIAVDDKAVGGIGLHLGTDVERISAELGYWLGEPYWGRGIVSEAVALITKYGLEELGLARIFAVPYAHNVASHRVLEKSGYEREGIMRSSAIKDGVIWDQYLYARVRA